MKKLFCLLTFLCGSSLAHNPGSINKNLVGIGQGLSIMSENIPLYTFGCGPCICLLIHSFNESNKSREATLIHLQPKYPKQVFENKLKELLLPYNNHYSVTKVILVSSNGDATTIQDIIAKVSDSLENASFDNEDVEIYHGTNDSAIVYTDNKVNVMTDKAYMNNNNPLFTTEDMKFQYEHQAEIFFYKQDLL